jgi:hypothetical protein
MLDYARATNCDRSKKETRVGKKKRDEIKFYGENIWIYARNSRFLLLTRVHACVDGCSLYQVSFAQKASQNLVEGFDTFSRNHFGLLLPLRRLAYLFSLISMLNILSGEREEKSTRERERKISWKDLIKLSINRNEIINLVANIVNKRITRAD